MVQLLLDLSTPPLPSLDNFVPGQNVELVQILSELAAGTASERFIYLWGEPGSGRTHLLKGLLFAGMAAGWKGVYCPCQEKAAWPIEGSEADLFAMDDVEALGDEAQIALFNLYNRVREGYGAIAVAGSQPPSALNLREDLTTRLAWGLVFRVNRLTDGDKAAALMAHAAERGMRFTRDLASYLLTHGPRDLPYLIAVLDAVDRYSLETHRPVTLPLLKDVLNHTVRSPEVCSPGEAMRNPGK